MANKRVSYKVSLDLQEGHGGFDMSRSQERCVACNPERQYGFADMLDEVEAEGKPSGSPSAMFRRLSVWVIDVINTSYPNLCVGGIVGRSALVMPALMADH